MYMCTSVDTLQAKIYKILADISGVKTYIDDLIVLKKEKF